MGSPLGPALANAFLVHCEKNWLRNYPSDFKPHYYRRYVADIFVLFTSPRHLEAFSNFLNGRHANLSFTIEREKQNRMSFLHIAIIRVDKTFTTSVYQKSTFSGVYTYFDSFLPSTYKFGNVYTLAYRCFRICSSRTKLHNELVCLKETFLKNGYSEDFINKCFKKFLDNIHIVKETTLTVERKSLVLVLPYFGSISLQTRTKLKKSLKNILNCCKLQIVFKNKTRLGNNFHFKDQIPKDFTSGVVYKFQCGLCNESYYGECIRHLNVRIGEHTGISPLTRKQVKPKNNSVADHLLLCNHSGSYDDFSILTRDNSKFLLELKESLLILRDKPSLNTNMHQHHCTYSTRSSKKIFARILFILIVATLFLLFAFYYLVMCKCMSTTVCGNGTVEFTFFFIRGLNFTIITCCDSLIVILVLNFSSSLNLKMD